MELFCGISLKKIKKFRQEELKRLALMPTSPLKKTCYHRCSVMLKAIIVIALTAVSQTSFASTTFFQQQDSLSLAQNTPLQQVKNLLKDDQKKEALTALHELKEQAFVKKDSTGLVDIYILFADIHTKNGDYNKLQDYYNIALPFARKDLYKLQELYLKKGGRFQLNQEIDSAFACYTKGIAIGKNLSGNTSIIAKLHANLSGIHYYKASYGDKDYSQAIRHSEIAASLQKKLGDKEMEAGIYNNLGGIYSMQGKHSNSLQLFKKALQIVGYGKKELQQQIRIQSLSNVAYTYFELKNYEKAYEYQDAYISLRDTLDKQLKYKEIAEIEGRYNTATKEKENALLRVDFEKEKQQKLIGWVGFLIAVLALITGAVVVRERRKKNALNAQLQSAAAREEERQQIAKSLHDEVAGDLVLLQQQLKKTADSSLLTQVSHVKNTIRTLSHNLSSVSFEEVSFVDQVINLVSDYYEEGFKIQVAGLKEILWKNTNNAVKRTLYLCVRESIQNAKNHAEAPAVSLVFEQTKAAVSVQIVDNGSGFVVADTTEGIGLLNMRKRAKELQGTCMVDSNDAGTCIQIQIPIR